MKVYIVCKCHPTCFIQHASLFILSFVVKSKMETDMLVDSHDEKLGWVFFQKIIKELIVEDRYAFKEIFWMSVEDFCCIFLFFPIVIYIDGQNLL